MVIDTNVFIKHLRAENKSKTLLSQTIQQNSIFITSITLFELWIGATNKQKQEDINKLTNGIPVLNLDAGSSKIAAETFLTLKSRNQLIEFRDIFIAAICIKTTFQ
jgi:tRNA(fMet)-specific endonuclease VapC